jgi:uncharacterized repeat protein (TIGR03803 family)
MPSYTRSLTKNRFLVVLFCALTVAIFAPTSAQTQTETVLYSFTGQPDGQAPYGNLIFDAAGNLYGTTFNGGETGGGEVFKMAPQSGGGWSYSILFSFNSDSSGAYAPFGGLVFDSDGNLYGTTYFGGAYGNGTVFELRPRAGSWTIQILHSFDDNGKDGAYPASNVTLDSAGNVYGTTSQGGIQNGGVVFELVRGSTGGFQEKLLHSFSNPNTHEVDTQNEPVIFDSAGNLYGVEGLGGTDNDGVVYELSPQSSGVWKYSVLFDFNGTGGITPTSNLLFDSAGNLYGTAEGSTDGYGVVYELTKGSNGKWTEKILNSFGFGGPAYPEGAIAFDSAGNLYGTTFEGDGTGGFVFELSPTTTGEWTQTLLHTFGSAGDGSYPHGGVVLDGLGNIYGTTTEGGADNFGTIWEVTP